jgi:hypothetical protein
LHVFNVGERRRLAADSIDQTLQGTGIRPSLDKHSFPVIPNMPAHAQRIGDTPHRGTESDTLHDAAEANPLAADGEL